MKIFGFSALAIVGLFVGIGMFFTVIQPQQKAKQINSVPEVVLGTSSHIDFSS